MHSILIVLKKYENIINAAFIILAILSAYLWWSVINTKITTNPFLLVVATYSFPGHRALDLLF